MGSILRTVFGWIAQTIVVTVIAEILASYFRHARERAEQNRNAPQ